MVRAHLGRTTGARRPQQWNGQSVGLAHNRRGNPSQSRRNDRPRSLETRPNLLIPGKDGHPCQRRTNRHKKKRHIRVALRILGRKWRFACEYTSKTFPQKFLKAVRVAVLRTETPRPHQLEHRAAHPDSGTTRTEKTRAQGGLHSCRRQGRFKRWIPDNGRIFQMRGSLVHSDAKLSAWSKRHNFRGQCEKADSSAQAMRLLRGEKPFAVGATWVADPATNAPPTAAATS